MFCTPDPCACVPVKPKKQAARKKVEPLTSQPIPVSVQNSGASIESQNTPPKVDIKAAMKQAIQPEQPLQPAPKKPTPGRVVTVETLLDPPKSSQASAAIAQAASETSSQETDEEEEFKRCVNLLAPLLHDDELSKFSGRLAPVVRAKVWRQRHVSDI